MHIARNNSQTYVIEICNEYNRIHVIRLYVVRVLMSDTSKAALA